MQPRTPARAARVWVEHAKAGIGKFFVDTTHQTDTAMYHGQKPLIRYDRSVTPAAVATAVTAYGIDGLTGVPCPQIPGLVQGRFAGTDRAAWVVYDDAGVVGRRHLDAQQLPRAAELLDVMSNNPRRDGVKLWEIGMQSLFVLAPQPAPTELAAAVPAALRE